MKKNLQKVGALLLACVMMFGIMCPTAYASPYWIGEKDGIVYQHVVLDSEKIPVDIGAVPGTLSASGLEGGTMAAQKFGAFANEEDAANGIVKLTLDVVGKPVEVNTIMDVVIIADESGSLNMYGRAEQGERKENKTNGPLNVRDSASYMPCLNEDHAYLVGDIQEELYKIALVRMEAAIEAGETIVGVDSIREKLKNHAVSYDVYINPHDVGLEYTVFGKWGSVGTETLVREMLKAAKLVDGSPANVDIPDILTDDDVYLALLSDWDEVGMTSNGHLTFTTNVVVKANDEYNIPRPTGEIVLKTGIRDGWDPDTSHCHFVNGKFELIPQPDNTDKIVKKADVEEFYSYWSPDADNEYGCYDRMMIEKEGLVSLADDILSADSRNRVAYVGFCYSAYKSLTTGAFLNKTQWDELETVLGNTNGHDYTNYIDPLNVAAGIINGRTDTENRSCYVVFVSDGMPNKNNFGGSNGYVDPCFNIVEEGYADTLYGELVAAPTNFTTVEAMAVGFKKFLAASESENIKFVTVGFCTNEEASELLKAMSSNEDTFFNCTDVESFLQSMKSIQEKLPAKYPSGVLTDVIGDDFDLLVDADHPFVVDGKVYESAEAAVEAGCVTIDGANLSWDLNDVDENGVQISFYVQVDDLEKYEALLPTNKDTEEATGANLTYHKVMANETNDGYVVDENPTNIALKTPYLLMTKDTSGSIQRIITFYKTAKVVENDKEFLRPLMGIEFDIYYLCSVEEYNLKLQNGQITEETPIDKLPFEKVYVTTVKTGEDGKAMYNLTENKQPDGIYLIEEREHDAIEEVLDPFLVAVPGSDKLTGKPVYVVELKPKNVPVRPDIKKDVMKPSYDMDENVTWIIQGDIPKDMAKALSYVITDQLDERLTYVGNVVVKAEKIDAAKVKPAAETGLLVGTDYTLNVKGNSIKIELTKEGRAKVAEQVGADYADYELRVYFDTYIDADAAMGEAIPNDATLEYINSANFKWVVLPEKKPEVYTTGINVHKYDAKDNTKALSGAVFKLAQVVDKDTAGAVPLVIKNAEGKVESVYAVYKEFYIDAACTTKANTVTTDDAGNALLYGLEAGTYYLVETKAPAGYNLLSYPVKVNLDQTSHHTGDIKATEEIVEVDRTVYVANSNTFKLPETGGIGTAIFTLAGSLMMGGAGVMLVNKKREED